MKPIAVAAALLISLVSSSVMTSAAMAQTVYRCGNSYSEVACPEGRRVEVGDGRSTAQAAEARRVADDTRRLAAEMRRDRLVEEREAHEKRLAKGGLAAASLSGSAPARPIVVGAPLQQRKRHSARPQPSTTDFIAFDPTSRKRRSGA